MIVWRFTSLIKWCKVGSGRVIWSGCWLRSQKKNGIGMPQDTKRIYATRSTKVNQATENEKQLSLFARLASIARHNFFDDNLGRRDSWLRSEPPFTGHRWQFEECLAHFFFLFSSSRKKKGGISKSCVAVWIKQHDWMWLQDVRTF